MSDRPDGRDGGDASAQPSPEWLAEATAHAEEAYPCEACGLVVKDDRGRLTAVRARNAASDPRVRFEVEAGPLLDAVRSGRLVGFYHSHPDGPAAPSADDLEQAALWGPELEWAILSVARGRVVEARSFRHGVRRASAGSGT